MSRSIRLAAAAAALLLSATLAVGCASSHHATQGDAAHTEDAVAHFTWDQTAQAMQGGAVLVDARGAGSYTKGHIEGAINVPCSDEAAYSQLPEDKNTQLIFYCGGPSCSASIKGAVKAKAMGYANVAEFKGGYPEWAKAMGK